MPDRPRQSTNATYFESENSLDFSGTSARKTTNLPKIKVLEQLLTILKKKTTIWAKPPQKPAQSKIVGAGGVGGPPTPPVKNPPTPPAVAHPRILDIKIIRINSGLS